MRSRCPSPTRRSMSSSTRRCSRCCRAINVNVDPLPHALWEKLLRDAGFAIEVQTGDMTLLDPAGLVRDEGFDGAMKIIRNGLRTENLDRFRKMFNFFFDHNKEFSYIAVVSRK